MKAGQMCEPDGFQLRTMLAEDRDKVTEFRESTTTATSFATTTICGASRSRNLPTVTVEFPATDGTSRFPTIGANDVTISIPWLPPPDEPTSSHLV